MIIHYRNTELSIATLWKSVSSSHIYSVKKVSDIIFLRKSYGFYRSALAWGDFEPSYASVNFFRLSIASLDGKQHLIEVMFNASVGFYCKENDGSRVVLVHPRLTEHAGLHKQWPRLHEHHNHWWRILDVRVQTGIRHFP